MTGADSVRRVGCLAYAALACALLLREPPYKRTFGIGGDVPTAVICPLPHRCTADIACYSSCQRTCRILFFSKAALVPSAGAHFQSFEIGRASCRERLKW